MDPSRNRKDNSLSTRTRRADDAIATSEKRMQQTEERIREAQRRMARLLGRVKPR